MQRRSCSFFFILLLGTGTLSVTVTLETFRGCAVRQFSFLAQKPGCRSLRITTEACWGRCHTWEDLLCSMHDTRFSSMLFHACGALQKPLPEPPYVQRHHRVCTYSRIRYLTARLPACLPDVSPLYPYPLALQCDCAVCSTQDTECETF